MGVKELMPVETPKQLVKMANQIFLNLRANGSDDVVAEHVATHLQKFWSPPMRQMIIAQLTAPETDLLPVTIVAIEKLSQMQHAKRD